MGPAIIRPISEEQYLAQEAASPVKHEFVGQRVYAMAGASERHNTITGNLFAACHAAARGACRPFMSDMRLRLDGGTAYYYPDVMLVCDPTDTEPMFKTATCMVAEVMSKSTEPIDRREKLIAYQKLPSLRECLLVAQDEALVEHYQRVSPREWALTTLGLADTIELLCISLKLAVANLYRGIDFNSATAAA
jgi:Uma2 family endonuclease